MYEYNNDIAGCRNEPLWQSNLLFLASQLELRYVCFGTRSCLSQGLLVFFVAESSSLMISALLVATCLSLRKATVPRKVGTPQFGAKHILLEIFPWITLFCEKPIFPAVSTEMAMQTAECMGQNMDRVVYCQISSFCSEAIRSIRLITFGRRALLSNYFFIS
jgi:hypothetical protein